MRDPNQFHRVATYISSVYPPLLLLVGLVCNPFSFYIFSRPAFQNQASSVYFQFLSIIDLSTIVFGTLFATLETFFTFDRSGILTYCRFSYFAGQTLSYSSTWALVSVSVDRVLSIVLPQKVHQVCTPRKALLVSALVLTVFVPITIPVIVNLQVVEVPVTLGNGINVTKAVCSFADESLFSALRWIDLFIFAFIPYCILAVSNVVILREVAKSRRRLEKFRGAADSRGKTDGREKARRETAGETRNKPSKTATKQRAKENTLKKTIVLVNAAFLFCNLPVVMYRLTPQSVQSPIAPDISLLLTLLANTNNVLNFALYYIAGSKFRAEVKVVFKAILGKRQPTC